MATLRVTYGEQSVRGRACACALPATADVQTDVCTERQGGEVQVTEPLVP